MEIAPDKPLTPSQQIQFRLRSIFILMAIAAVTFGIVPLWYRYVVALSILPNGLTHDYSEGSDQEWQVRRQTFIDHSCRYAPGFSLLAFAGCCGLWFAYIEPTKRVSDIWIGGAYGVSLLIVAFPQIILWTYGFPLSPLMYAFGFHHPPQGTLAFVLAVVILAAIYSFWLLYLKRIHAALLLFGYRCFYGGFATLYLLDIVASAID